MDVLAADFVERDAAGVPGKRPAVDVEPLARQAGPLKIVPAVCLDRLDGLGWAVNAAGFPIAIQAVRLDAAPVEIRAADIRRIRQKRQAIVQSSIRRGADDADV